jgi:hypothetical protein
MATAVFAESENFQHLMWFIPESYAELVVLLPIS